MTSLFDWWRQGDHDGKSKNKLKKPRNIPSLLNNNKISFTTSKHIKSISTFIQLLYTVTEARRYIDRFLIDVQKISSKYTKISGSRTLEEIFCTKKWKNICL